MPAEQIGLPVGATNVKLHRKGYTYPIDIDVHGFTRTGKDGAEKILGLFTDEEFQGEYLEPHWKKGWSAGMDADQAFTAIVDTANARLPLEGEADVAGTYGYGWVNSILPLVLMDGLQLTVAMQVPTDDTGVTAALDITQGFYLTKNSVETNPDSEADWIRVDYFVDESGLLLRVYKKIGGVETLMATGHDYTMDTTKGTGNLEATIWRIVFSEPDSVTSTRHVHIYLKQSDTLANAETATENEITGSPFDISDLLFETAYPACRIGSQNTTIFDAANQALYDYIRVKYVNDPDYNYPPYSLRFDITEANRNKGDCEVWDTMGSATESEWQQVFDEDHVFTGDCYIQNGLIRLQVDEGVQYGLKLYGYYSGTWNMPFERLYWRLFTSSKDISYPFINKINSISPERTVISVRVADSAVENEDFYVDVIITLERGKYSLKIEFSDVFPLQETYVYYITASRPRFGFTGNASTLGIADSDLLRTVINTTMTDNFTVAFDDTGAPILIGIAHNKKPTAAPANRTAYRGGYFYMDRLAPGDVLTTIVYYYIAPFALVENLFKEAESATISASARSYLDGEGNCVDSVCEAQPDRVGGIDIDGNDFNFWAVDDCVRSQCITYGLRMQGNESTKIVVAAVPAAGWSVRHTYGGAQNWDGEDYVGFWLYGNNTGVTMQCQIRDTDVDFYNYPFLDDFSGWKWIALDKATYVANGVDFTKIDYIQIGASAPGATAGKTYYLDFVNAYTLGADKLWDITAPTNCATHTGAVNDVSVGTYNTRIRSAAGNWVYCYVDPTDVLGNILKFDFLKFYAHRGTANPGQLTVSLVDADGDEVYKQATLTLSAQEFSWALPHSVSDLQGWTQVGTYNFGTFRKIKFWWFDVTGGNEDVYIDGLRFYIGTTTARGRGETLSGSSAGVLDAQFEEAWLVTNPLNIPEGKYLVIIRAKDTDQVVSDTLWWVRDDTDAKYLNEENTTIPETLTGIFAYYIAVVDIPSSSVGNRVDPYHWRKNTVTENTIFIDYVLIIPLGDGESGPMDLAHGALQTGTRKRRLPLR